MHRYKTAWYSLRPPVSTRDFQAVKLEASKGAWGERSELGRKRGAGRWRTVVAKRASRRRVGRSGQAT